MSVVKKIALAFFVLIGVALYANHNRVFVYVVNNEKSVDFYWFGMARNFYVIVEDDNQELYRNWVHGYSLTLSKKELDTNKIIVKVAMSGRNPVVKSLIIHPKVKLTLLAPVGGFSSSSPLFSWDADLSGDYQDFALVNKYNKVVFAQKLNGNERHFKASNIKDGQYWWSINSYINRELVASAKAPFTISSEIKKPFGEIVFGVPKEIPLPPENTTLSLPEWAAYGPDGALYIADTYANVIRRCTTEICQVYAGSFVAGNKDGLFNTAMMNQPTSGFFDNKGDLFINDMGNKLVKKVSENQVETVWAHGKMGKSIYQSKNNSITVGALGGIFASKGKSTLQDKSLYPIAYGDVFGGFIVLAKDLTDRKFYLLFYRNGELEKRIPVSDYSSCLFVGADQVFLCEHTVISSFGKTLERKVIAEGFANVTNIAAAAKNNLIVTDSDAGVVETVNMNNGKRKIVVGGKGLASVIVQIVGYKNYLFFLDSLSASVWRYNIDNGAIDRWIGTGNMELATIGASRMNTGLFYPSGIAVDNLGNIFVVEQHHILKINAETDKVELYAGGQGRGIYGFNKGTVNRQSALFQSINKIFFDEKDQSLYVADTYNNAIRVIKGDSVSTLVSPEEGQYKYPLNKPSDIFVSDDGYYVSDSWNNTIIKIDKKGIFSTIAGRNNPKPYQGEGGYSGDGESAINAQLNSPGSISVSDNTIYIADTFNNRIRKVKDGVICTVIGRAYSGYSPSDIHVLNLPSAIFVAGDYLYVGDAMNGVVKRFRQSDIGCQ